MLGPLVQWGPVNMLGPGAGGGVGGVLSGMRLGFGLWPCLGLVLGVLGRGWFQVGACDCGVGSLDVWASSV